MAISECERAFLVSTAELPSLHLTRKAMTLVDQLGFPKDRFHVLVNRVDKRDEIGAADMEKLFDARYMPAAQRLFFAAPRGDAGPAAGSRRRTGQGHRRGGA